MKKLLPLLLALPILSPTLNAQSVKGRILDATSKQGVEYASIRLFGYRDSSLLQGTLSDSSGTFQLKAPGYGQYRIEISFIGYLTRVLDSVTLTRESPDKNFTPIYLEPDQELLDEVVVNEERSMMSYGIDKKVYNPEKDLISRGGSATDMLQNIPSVQIDADRNIQFRGSSNITVYIDGKPSTLTGSDRTAILDQIPANNIERIEIISNPSAKYDAEGSGGIINIVTKRGAGRAYEAVVTLNAGTHDKYQGNILLSRKWKKWELGLSYGFNQRHTWKRNSSLRESTDSTGYIVDQSTDGIDRDYIHNGKITLDYLANERNTFGFFVSLNRQHEDEDELTDYDFQNESRFRDSFGYRLNLHDEVRLNRDLGMNWNHRFRKKGHQLTWNFSISDNSQEDNLEADQSMFLPDWSYNRPPFQQNTSSSEYNYLHTLQGDHILPLTEKSRLESGIKLTLRGIDNDFYSESRNSVAEEFTEDVNLSNRFKYQEEVYAFYSNYSREMKRWSVSAGMRGELTRIHSKQFSNGEEYNRNYFNLFPSLFLGYQLTSNQELQASVSRRIDRPGARQLNPFRSFSDPLNQREGNPFLNPEYILSYEVNYNLILKKFNLTAGLYWRTTYDRIIRYRTLTQEGVTLTSYQNLDESRSAGAEFVTQYSFNKRLRSNVNLNIYQVNMKGDNLLAGLGNSVWGGNLRLSTNATITRNLSGQLSYNFFRPGWALQGTIRSFQSLDLGVQQDLFKGKGSIGMRVSDLFNTRQFQMETLGAGFTQQNLWKRESRILYLNFSYRFGNDSLSGRKRGGNRPDGDGGGMDDF